ncbi:MAG: hypothetical protein ACK4SY_02175 [Pyrobaculum sp.]
MEPLSPSTLAWITAGVAVPAVVLVYALNGVDRRWATAVGLISVIALMAIFGYTANVIMSFYSAVEFPPDVHTIELGVAYQRVAAGQLAAASMVIGLLAIGYYMEISKRGHE